MRLLLLLTATFLFSYSYGKSEIETDTVRELAYINQLLVADSAGGSISIDGDPRINELVWKHVKMSEYEGGIDGWRIQIYNSSGREAREEANEVRTKFLNKYPDLKAYLIYQPPYFKIRIGDYRSKQEAYTLYKQIVRHFPVSYLVPDKINFPDLEHDDVSVKRKDR